MSALTYFNPRTSYEVRPGFSQLRPRPLYFNPRTSYEVRRLIEGELHDELTISIHAPLTRCDKISKNTKGVSRYFNPRTSYEVRPTEECMRLRAERISIHAPLTRCDLFDSTSMRLFLVFQSTHLLRGATGRMAVLDTAADDFNPRTSYEVRLYEVSHIPTATSISIHAPLTRCDLISIPAHFAKRLFQSTHLLRGATLPSACYAYNNYPFQSTHLLRGATSFC